MKLKVLTYSLLLNALLFAVVLLASKQASRSRANYNRVLEANEVLNTKLSNVQLVNGRVSATNQVLQLKNRELEKLIPQLHQEIKEMSVKTSRTESLSATAFTSETRIETVLKDSTVFDTVPVRQFRYADEFYRIEGFSVNDTQHLSITYQDTLIQTVYRGKRKKTWLWIFSPRQLEQRVALKNPNATINYSQHIQILP